MTACDGCRRPKTYRYDGGRKWVRCDRYGWHPGAIPEKECKEKK